MLNLKHVIFVLFFIPCFSHARVFNFQESGFSTYIRGAYGLVNIQKLAFEPGFPASTTFSSGSVAQNYGGEVGFAYQSKNIGFRFGVELLYPVPSVGLLGKNAGGTTLVTLDSTVISVIPKAAFEYSYKQSSGFKAFFGLGGGYANTTIQNTANLTVPGQAAYGLATSNYTEEGWSPGIMCEAFTGFEFAFFDNVGFSLDVGYRYLYNSGFNATRAAQTPNQNIAIGDTIRSLGGTNRYLNLSGAYAGASFRIYLR